MCQINTEHSEVLQIFIDSQKYLIKLTIWSNITFWKSSPKRDKKIFPKHPNVYELAHDPIPLRTIKLIA